MPFLAECWAPDAQRNRRENTTSPEEPGPGWGIQGEAAKGYQDSDQGLSHAPEKIFLLAQSDRSEEKARRSRYSPEEKMT